MAKMNVYGEPLEAPIKKRVLLFSGGMDSWIALHLWKPDICLYCFLNHRYQRRELETISTLQMPNWTTLRFEERISLGEEERADSIIPLRNAFLLLFASRYGDSLGMGVLKGEVNGDKSEEFRQHLQKVLNICYGNSYWCEGRDIEISYPLVSFSKSEAIAEYLRVGGSPTSLIKTRSCYESHTLPCGRCSACVKRFIALSLNGLAEEYEEDPRGSVFVEEFRKRLTTYDEQRRSEFRKVFG